MNRLGAGLNRRTTWQIRHGAGVLDISISGATNLLWQFPDGSTSTVARPAKTVTKGTTIITCDDFSASGVDVYIYGDSTALASYPIQVKSLPALTYRLSANANGIIGKVADLPRVTNYLHLISLAGLTGTTADLPRDVNTLYLNTLAGLTGTAADMPLNTGTTRRIIYLAGITGALPVVSTNTTVYYYGNSQVTPAEYDQTIQNIVDAGGVNGTLRISNTRTSASDANIATLQSRGWTVTEY